MTQEDITRKLHSHALEWMPLNRIQPAGVLIPLIENGDSMDVVLEVRAKGIAQSGEVCLPGGHLEEGETTCMAAVRETCEELRVEASQIEVVAPMVAVTGPSGRIVESHLAFLRDYEGTYAPSEVDHVLTVPLRHFYETAPIIGNVDLVAQLGDDFPSHLLAGEQEPWFHPIPRTYYFYPVQDQLVWGLTAYILKRTAEIVYGDEH